MGIRFGTLRICARAASRLRVRSRCCAMLPRPCSIACKCFRHAVPKFVPHGGAMWSELGPPVARTIVALLSIWWAQCSHHAVDVGGMDRRWSRASGPCRGDPAPSKHIDSLGEVHQDQEKGNQPDFSVAIVGGRPSAYLGRSQSVWICPGAFPSDPRERCCRGRPPREPMVLPQGVVARCVEAHCRTWLACPSLCRMLGMRLGFGQLWPRPNVGDKACGGAFELHVVALGGGPPCMRTRSSDRGAPAQTQPRSHRPELLGSAELGAWNSFRLVANDAS